jgi:hypothetical protein
LFAKNGVSSDNEANRVPEQRLHAGRRTSSPLSHAHTSPRLVEAELFSQIAEFAMGLFALLTRFLPSLSRRNRAPNFAAAPFAPTRLERRRVLDAAAAGLVLEALPDVQPYVQTGENLASIQDSPELSEQVAEINGFPQATMRLRDAEVFEDQSTLAVIEIRDSSPMAHQVTIDWGDGSPLQVINAGPQQRDVLAVHKFLDDNPSGTDADTYTVKAKVTNTLGEEVTTSAEILVKNVAPKIDSLSISSPINENGTATLTGTYSDAGTQDTHILEIDWNDDGYFEQSIDVSGGSFSVSQQFLDDDPSGTTSDTFNVNVRLRDDDGGQASDSVPLTVRNVAPAITGLSITSPITENGTATLSGTYTDIGTRDTHALDIDWNGDGSFDQTVNIAGGSFSVSRQFLDDNPSGTLSDTFNVIVRLRDDDGGTTVAAATLTVQNANPIVELSPLAIINENGMAILSGTYADVGLQDTHELDIDWDGDGIFDETIAVTGGAFTVTRQFLDDNPTGTSSDTFDVNVRIRDDDGGVGTDSQPLTVRNVGPVLVDIAITSPITENDSAVLTGTYQDVGTQDTHTLDIDWDGDGVFDDTVGVSGGTFLVSHQFLDDDPTGTGSDTFNVNVRLRDDDGGEDFATVSLTVENANPTVTLNPLLTIDENGAAVLSGVYQDAGSQDTHELDIDWDDDGVFDETIAVTGGAFLVTRRFLDDNPTGTASDTFNVKVRLRDDDGGVGTDSKPLTVRNVNPVVTLIPPSEINEDEIATLFGSVTDAGTLDTFTLTVNWGEPASPGNVQTFALGTTPLTQAADGINWNPTTRQFSIDHQYLDDNPTNTPFNTYNILVNVTDDDTGFDRALTTITVRNQDLTLQLADNQTVDEGAILDLTSGQLGSFDDAGTQDTHTATVDWGDGSGLQTVMVDELNGSGTLSASHTYADNGVYSVTVSVIDDDAGRVTGTFRVTVLNVDPTLMGADSPIFVDEGELITLDGLRVALKDPGFDNPNNPLGASAETLAAHWVNWGDGTGNQPLFIGSETDGGPGTATTASFAHAAHAYADDGTYTVTVRVSDDDGVEVDRTFTIVVENVDPTLMLTTRDLEISEGQTLELPDLGTFTDPGYNNRLNPNGESFETFHYSIDWGDTTPTQNRPNVATVDDGEQGVKTTGTLHDSHRYLDNDNNNLYTITVTIFDDDGGSDTETIQVRVLNVNPSYVDLDPRSPKVIIATDVNTKGQSTLTIHFVDPGTEAFYLPDRLSPFEVHVDWGDQLTVSDPNARFVLEEQLDGNPVGPLTYTHQYSGPPDPSNPSADITIRVKIRDDDFYTVTPLGAVGESVIADVSISNPGIGAEPFRIDTTPKVPQLTFPARTEIVSLQNNSSTGFTSQQNVVLGGAGGETQATADRYIELRVIDAEGNEGPGYRLRPEVLRDLPGLFRSLPDNHYAVYIVNTETNTRRLVIEVYVRNGKLIDPGDDSEGTRDRPPTDEQTIQPATDVPGDQAPPTTEQGAAVEEIRNALHPDRIFGLPEESTPRHWNRWTMLAVGLAASTSSKNWAYRVDQALAKATTEQWRKLQGYNPSKRNKP